tara:strand:+ start:991 stop:1386 length:396 start_codon:yes stop_codon:yes gene_type:complete
MKLDLMKMFNKLCDPAKLYVMLSLASVVVYIVHFMRQSKKIHSIKDLGLQVLLMFIWTAILNKVCSFKYGEKISWILVFLPVILMIVLIMIAFKMVDELDLTKDDIHKLLNKENKDLNEEDELEGFQGCGS